MRNMDHFWSSSAPWSVHNICNFVFFRIDGLCLYISIVLLKEAEWRETLKYGQLFLKLPYLSFEKSFWIGYYAFSVTG